MRTLPGRTESFEGAVIARLDRSANAPTSTGSVAAVTPLAIAEHRLSVALTGAFKRTSRKASTDARKGAQRTKARLLAIVGCQCEACRIAMPTPRLVHLHHIRRVADGGNSEPENTILLCPNCHARSHWIYANLMETELPTSRQELVDLLVRARHV